MHLNLNDSTRRSHYMIRLLVIKSPKFFYFQCSKECDDRRDIHNSKNEFQFDAYECSTVRLCCLYHAKVKPNIRNWKERRWWRVRLGLREQQTSPANIITFSKIKIIISKFIFPTAPWTIFSVCSSVIKKKLYLKMP